MRNGNLLDSVEGLCTGCDVVHLVKYLGAVVSHSATIAHADGDSFEYDKSFFVLESLSVNLFWTHRAFAVLAYVIVKFFLSGLL